MFFFNLGYNLYKLTEYNNITDTNVTFDGILYLKYYIF